MTKRNFLISLSCFAIAIMIGTLSSKVMATDGSSTKDNVNETMHTGSTSSPTSTATSKAEQQKLQQTDQQRLSLIQSRGNAEIERRLKFLNGQLTSKINLTTKLTSSDKTVLLAEVSSTISGLNSLKAQLDGETSAEAVKTDVQNIINEYRVYVLVTPKISTIVAADGQQATEAKLQSLYTKIQTRLAQLQSKGINVSSQENTLADMNKQVTAAIAISAAVESKALNLQPGDYNGDHTVLSQYLNQIKQAQADIKAAYSDAKTIVQGLKALNTQDSNSNSSSKTGTLSK